MKLSDNIENANFVGKKFMKFVDFVNHIIWFSLYIHSNDLARICFCTTVQITDSRFERKTIQRRANQIFA